MNHLCKKMFLDFDLFCWTKQRNNDEIFVKKGLTSEPTTGQLVTQTPESPEDQPV